MTIDIIVICGQNKMQSYQTMASIAQHFDYQRLDVRKHIALTQFNANKISGNGWESQQFVGYTATVNAYASAKRLIKADYGLIIDDRYMLCPNVDFIKHMQPGTLLLPQNPYMRGESGTSVTRKRIDTPILTSGDLSKVRRLGNDEYPMVWQINGSL